MGKFKTGLDHPNFKHGLKNHPIYGVWADMKKRCQNPKATNYLDYGGRGIKVCDRWQTFIYFAIDMLPTWKQGLSIGRINNDDNYYPENCRWETDSEQNRNRRVQGAIPFKGVTRENGRYRARIRIQGKKASLGSYDTPEEAYEAYLKAWTSL